MSELKFCCDRFRSYYEADMEIGFRRVPNIKIIKYKPEHSKLIGRSGNLGFCIATTLNEKWDSLKAASIFINYCPFCGKPLHKFYNNEGYANEIDGITFGFFHVKSMNQDFRKVSVEADKK